MWVTQTYIGAMEPNAKAFVYYFYESYNEQKAFSEQVQRELEDLGDVYRDSVSLLMPNPRYAGRIEAEVRENMELWTSLRGSLPGLFVSPVPLARLADAREEAVYVPFSTRDVAGVAAAIAEVRDTAEALLARASERGREFSQRSLGGRLLDALELKPGIWGFRLDLRRLRGPR